MYSISISISFHHIFIQIPSWFCIAIGIGAPDGVRGIDSIPSDDGVWSESKTDIGHEWGMDMRIVDLYIGKS